MLNTICFPFGIDMFCLRRKFLLANFVARNLKLKYRRSFLGFAWSLVVPLTTATMYYIVFQLIARIHVPHYVLYIVSGVLPWTAFVQSVTESLESIVANDSLITRIPIPSQVFPLNLCVTNFINLLFSLPVILFITWWEGMHLSAAFLALPFIFALLILTAYSLGLILAVAFVYFRDLKHITSLVMQLWMYATPIVYTVDMIPERFRWIFYANPIAPTISCIRDIVMRGELPGRENFLLMLIWVAALYLAASLCFKSFRSFLAENL